MHKVKKSNGLIVFEYINVFFLMKRRKALKEIPPRESSVRFTEQFDTECKIDVT